MAASDDPHHHPNDNGRDLDEKVRMPLPFEKALKGLLATEPPENGKAAKPREKQPKP